MIARTAETYIAACERITGAPFVPDMRGASVLARIRDNLAPWFPAAAGAGGGR